ncbi:zinc finger protein 26-like [Watersipora subatra]|uniref:zinc finger protein 26-like n=1 Tax=Watersipora subatra TaxID=2589382 RepID=UPI00355C90F6
MLGKTKKFTDSLAKKVKVEAVVPIIVESKKASPEKPPEKQPDEFIIEQVEVETTLQNKNPSKTYASRKKRGAVSAADSDQALADSQVAEVAPVIFAPAVVSEEAHSSADDTVEQSESATEVLGLEGDQTTDVTMFEVREVVQTEQVCHSPVKSSGVDFGGRSIVAKLTEEPTIEKADTSIEIGEAVEELPVIESDDVVVGGSLAEDGLTVIEEEKDSTTLPERTDAFNESDLLALHTEEVVLFKEGAIQSSKPALPKKKMMITANYKTLQSDMDSEKDNSVAEDGPLPAVVPEEAGLSPQSVSRESLVGQTEDEDPKPVAAKVPVTKTYIVGKNNTIQEVIMGKDNSVEEVLSSDPMPMSPKVPAGDSDDEEYEYEDEEERIRQEGLQQAEAVLFCDLLMEGYVVDDLVMAVFQKIKPRELLEAHCAADEDLGYKCNYCGDEGSEQLPRSKLEMVRHLKEAHIRDYAPWQCPICQFKCTYPGSLLLHMSMHTKNKPYSCTRCNKKFAYQQKLLKHTEYHDYKASKHCDLCKTSLNKTVVFHEQAALEAHLERRHTAPLKKIYEGDCKAIIQESRSETSLGDALQLLAGQVDASKSNSMYRLEKGSIKISDMGEIVEIPQNIVTSNSSSTDVIGNPNSVVQIMPVSFRNESGIPETINVVITVPPNEGAKIMNSDGQTVSAKPRDWQQGDRLIASTDWHTRCKMSHVDKELLNHCEVLDQPIHYRNQRAFIKCTECPKGMEVHFGSVTQFCEHLRKDHADKNIKPYKCAECNYTCRVKGNLDQHKKFHSTERPFTCQICGKGFIQKYKLNLHLKFHDNRREWVCEECGSSFNDKQDLSRHRKNVHFRKEDGVPCPNCPRVFKNEYMLSQHIHVHTGERNYKCSICEKSYSTRESLRSHMKGHQFQFGCEICAKPLGSYSAFIAHKRLHDPNQSGYTCDHCGKVLLFKATLEAHIRSVHSDAKDFRCEQCEKGFKTQAQLNNHMISHTKEKPYQCQICGYSVKRKDSLRQHMYRHAEVKPYRCGRCGKEYTQKQALEIHLKSKHAGVTTFNCTLCDRGFNTNYLLKKHMQKAHEVELVNKMPKNDQVIIAQQQIEEAADSEPPASGEVGVLPPVSKKQTVLINAHICEHCHEVFVSQHALAVHILSEHMNQSRVNAEEDAGNLPTNEEDGQVVNISETIEIPIGEEMVLVQSVEPGVLSTALEKGATRVISGESSNLSAGKSRTVSLLPSRADSKSVGNDAMDDDTRIVVTDATLDERESDGEMRVLSDVAVEEELVEEGEMGGIEVTGTEIEEEEVTTSEVADENII